MRIDGATSAGAVRPDAARARNAATAAAEAQARSVPRDKIELSQAARGTDSDGDNDGS